MLIRNKLKENKIVVVCGIKRDENIQINKKKESLPTLEICITKNINMFMVLFKR